jgi:hypothetical protein
MDEDGRVQETEVDKAMEAASDIRKIASLGDYLPRKCGVDMLTFAVLFTGRRESLRTQTCSWTRREGYR